MHKVLLTVVLVTTVIFLGSAQISCPTAPVRLGTAYTISTEQDSVFVVCAGQATSLVATSPEVGEFSYQWATFSPLTQAWSPQAMQFGTAPFLYNTATAGGYRIQIFDENMNVLHTYHAWVSYVVQPGSVTATGDQVGCGTSIELNASVVLPSITPYVDPAAPSVPIYPVMDFGWHSTQGILNAIPNLAVQTTAVSNITADTQIIIAPSSPWNQLACLSSWADTIAYDYISANDVVFIDIPSLLCANTPNFIMQTNYPGTWTGQGVVNGSTGEFSPVVSGAGFFPLTFHSSTPGCSFSKQMMVVVQPFITPTILVPSVVCSVSEPIDLLPSVNGGNWSGDGIIDPVEGIFDPEVSGPGVFQITYRIENSCFGLAYATVAVQQTPVVSISGTDTICAANGAINLVGSPLGGIWSGSGIVNPTAGYFDPSLAVSGNNIISYDYNNGTGCSASTSFTVNVQEPINVSVSEAGPYCIDQDAVTLQASPSGGIWSGQGVVDALAGTFNPFFAGEGTHDVQYTLQNVCNNSDFISIQILIPQDIAITGIGNFCESDAPLTLSALPVGGSWTGIGVSNGSFNPSLAQIGDNNLFYTLPDLCASTSGIVTTVFANPEILLDYVSPICEGLSATINAFGADSYSWVDQNNNLLQSEGSAYTTQVLNGFEVTVRGLTAEGCASEAVASIDVNPTPEVTLDVPEVVCVNTPFQMSAEGLADYLWFPTSLFANPQQASQTLSISGLTTFQLSGFDANGCAPGPISFSIDISTLDLSFTVIDSVYAPGPVTFIPETDGTSVDWYFGNGDSLFNQLPNATIYENYPDPGFYESTIVATNGICTAEYIQEVQVLYPSGILLIPNVISPDGDVYNPGFRLYTQNLATIELKIFDRWGNELDKITTFEEMDLIGRAYTSYWIPENESTGTYFFEFTAKGKDDNDHARKGTFTIVRRELNR
jgi:hypothetical protein